MRRGPKPQPIVIPKDEQPKLSALANSIKAEYRLVVRARIILLAARGVRTVDIARTLAVTTRTVRKWKARFRADPRANSLQDAPRTGRPPTIPLEVRCRVISFACDRPDDHKVPFRSVWTRQALSDAVYRETGCRISTSEIGRILNFADLRPHHVRTWLHSQDPDFATKASAICDLYLHPPPGSAVLCIDEKPIQVTERKYPATIGPRGQLRREFEYIRHGTVVLFVAFNIRTGKVFGRICPHRTADDTVDFMEQVATRFRQKQVWVIWHNLNTHHHGPSTRYTKFNQRHRGRFHFVYTPLHASWMNQVECWLSIFVRRVLRHGSFDSIDHLVDTAYGFIDLWNRTEAHPFRWTWRADPVKNRMYA